MLRTVNAKWVGLLVVMIVQIALSSPAWASEARAEVVLAIERAETKLRDTRWHFNNLGERRALESEITLLKKLYDRIIDHEGNLNGFPCAGAVIDGRGGPPVSTEGTDQLGLLGQQNVGRAPSRGRRPTGARRTPPRSGAAINQFGQQPIGQPIIPGFRGFPFLRRITDVEVRLIAQIVYIEHRLETERWHFNNQNEQRQLQQALVTTQDELRRLRNSRC